MWLRSPAESPRQLSAQRPAYLQIERTQSAYYASTLGAPMVLSTYDADSEQVATFASAERPGTLAWLKYWNRWHSMRTTERRAVRRANAVLCVSEHDASYFARTAQRVVVVSNGADDQLFEIDSERPASESVLFVGNYRYEPNALGVSRFLRDAWPVGPPRDRTPACAWSVRGLGASSPPRRRRSNESRSSAPWSVWTTSSPTRGRS